MKHILLLLFTFSLIVIACSSAKRAKTSIKQGISGFIREARGNQMPSPDRPRSEPPGIKTTVFIYEPTNITDVTRVGVSPVYTAIHTKLVASVETDSTGAFAIALPVGSYSLFVQQGKQYYANLFDTNNNIALFTVEEDKLTKVSLTVSSSATY